MKFLTYRRTAVSIFLCMAAVALPNLGQNAPSATSKPPAAPHESNPDLDAGKPDNSESPGRTVYINRCSICHGDHREGYPRFPALLGVTRRMTPEQIAGTIHAGRGRMPPMPIAGAPLQELLDYLSTDEYLPPPTPPAAEEHAPAAPLPIDPALAPGAKVYAERCAICHGERMEGIPPHFPPLFGIGIRYTDEKLLALIHTGKSRMPAINTLSQQDTAALLRFLRASDALLRSDQANGVSKQVDAEGTREP